MQISQLFSNNVSDTIIYNCVGHLFIRRDVVDEIIQQSALENIADNYVCAAVGAD